MKTIHLDDKAFRLKVSHYLRLYHNYSGRSLRNIDIFLNDKKIKNTFKLPKSGILIIKEKEKKSNIIPIKLDLEIVYEDNDILIVNKAPFLLTHPSLKKADITLANAIVYYFKEKGINNFIPRFISRLDMNTSGLIMVAKNAYTQSFMQSNNSKLKKKYLAIAEGLLEKDEIIVEEKIYKDGDNLRRIIDNRGQEAKTRFKLIEKFKALDLSLVECELFTGRTHQIRVHLKHINHPIIGDDLYNEESIYSKLVNRQMLHSYNISFIHPISKKLIEIEIPMYKDMKELLYSYK